MPLVGAAVFALFFSLSFPLSAEDYDVKLSADSLVYDQGKKTIIMTGNVRFLYQDTILSGARAIFNTTTQEGRISGNVRISQPGTTITGDEMLVFYKKKQAKLMRNVKIVTVKDLANSPGKKKDMLSSGVTTLTCKEMEYDWLLREGEARGDVTVEQKDRRAFADKAHYSGNAELITMEGRVKFEQGSNDWVTCQKAYLDMKKETFMGVGGVTGNFLVKGEKKKDKEAEKKVSPLPADKLVIPDLPFKEKKSPE